MAEERLSTLGRTPLPEGVLKFQLVLNDDEAGYLRGLIDARPGLSVTNAVNGELDFLRLWGLTATRLPRLLHAAKAAVVQPKDYVQMLVARHVASLPATAKPDAPGSTSQRVKVVVNITGPNHALMLAHADRHNLSLPDAFRDLLKFARWYGLDPLQFAALREYAAERGATPRDVVQDVVNDAVSSLPEVEASSSSRRRSRRASNTA